MNEVRTISPLFPKRLFVRHLTRNILMGLAILLISLGIGMYGYHHYEKMGVVDAYVNASMILSGMGPVTELKTEGGKIFAGTYALFSGVIFLVAIAVIFIPVFRRVLHKLHLDEEKK